MALDMASYLPPGEVVGIDDLLKSLHELYENTVYISALPVMFQCSAVRTKSNPCYNIFL